MDIFLYIGLKVN